MSDEPGGPGWAQGIDGKWFRVDNPSPPPAPPTDVLPRSATGTNPRNDDVTGRPLDSATTVRSVVSRSSRKWLAVAALLLVVVLIASVLLLTTGGSSSPGNKADESARLLTMLPTADYVQRNLLPNAQSTFRVTSVTDAAGPQGALTAPGVETELDHGGAFQNAFESSQGGAGAYVSYRVHINSGTSLNFGVSVLAIKFPSERAGQGFAQQFETLITTSGKGEVYTANPGGGPYGVLSGNGQSVFRLPPGSPLGDPTDYTFLMEVLEPDGTYFLSSSTRTVSGGDPGAQALASMADGGYRACELNVQTCASGVRMESLR